MRDNFWFARSPGTEGREPAALTSPSRNDFYWHDNGLRERLVFPNPEDSNGSRAEIASRSSTTGHQQKVAKGG